MDALEQVYAKIPQRPPFLFMDRIIEISEGRIQTELKLTGEEDFFKGHFPNNPVMPGVLMCEACFQSAAALMADDEDGGLGVVTKIEQTKFKSMAKPGDILIIKTELLEKIENARYMKSRIEVNGKAIMQTKFTVASVAH